MYTQSEYGTAYAIVFGLLFLGLLVVCIPRPRRKNYLSPDEELKLKRAAEKKKKQKKQQKQKAKQQKKKAKAQAKKK